MSVGVREESGVAPGLGLRVLEDTTTDAADPFDEVIHLVLTVGGHIEQTFGQSSLGDPVFSDDPREAVSWDQHELHTVGQFEGERFGQAVVGDRADLVGDVVTGYREDGSGQAWPLRMTQQYRREDGSWRVITNKGEIIAKYEKQAQKVQGQFEKGLVTDAERLLELLQLVTLDHVTF